MKKILVTGGAGFVGSHLCEKLRSDGYDVYSLDNYFTGSEANHIEGVTYIKGSTLDIFDLIKFKPDTVYHLGEYSRVERSFEDVDKVFEFNVIGITAVLKFIRKTGAKLIYAGSSTKFGDGDSGRDASPYAWSKARNTELVINYANWFNIKYAITYFYNVYGGREIHNGDYATLIAIFKKRYEERKPLTVVSPGVQKRNFTHIDDIVNGLLLVGLKGYGDNFGIGSDKTYSILEVANMFEGEIEMLPERRGNRMTADVVTENTKKLGWMELYNLEQHIKNFVESKKKL